MKKAELINKIIELQRQLNQVMRQLVPDAWMDLNLTIAQLKTMFFIASEGSTNSRKLAAALGVTPADMTGILDRLVIEGLVSRTDNPEHPRMLLLRATGKGEALVANLRETTRSQVSDILARMNMKNLASLAQELTSLVEAAESYEGEIKRTAGAKS